jgi:hypothetical protein
VLSAPVSPGTPPLLDETLPSLEGWMLFFSHKMTRYSGEIAEQLTGLSIRTPAAVRTCAAAPAR